MTNPYRMDLELWPRYRVRAVHLVPYGFRLLSHHSPYNMVVSLFHGVMFGQTRVLIRSGFKYMQDACTAHAGTRGQASTKTRRPLRTSVRKETDLGLGRRRRRRSRRARVMSQTTSSSWRGGAER